MLTFSQEVELGKKLQIWSVAPEELKVVDLMSYGIPAAYIYEQTRGGKQIIVGNDWKVLSFASSMSIEKVVEGIKHNNLWSKAVEVTISLN